MSNGTIPIWIRYMKKKRMILKMTMKLLSQKWRGFFFRGIFTYHKSAIRGNTSSITTTLQTDNLNMLVVE